MTNYELWKAKKGYKEPDKFHIVCMNEKCATCPICKKFGMCESDDSSREKEILEWLDKEAGEEKEKPTIKIKKERVDMIKAMETIVRSMNDEEMIFGWLMNGVADGDINSETTDEEVYLNYCETDEQFADIMACFCRTMRYMVNDDELDKVDRMLGNNMIFCDGVVSMADKIFYSSVYERYNNEEGETTMTTGMGKVRRFNENDWHAFAGAEKFNSGSDPFIAEGNFPDGEVTLIADKTGIEVIIHYTGMNESYEETTYDWSFEEQLTALRAIGYIAMLVGNFREKNDVVDIAMELEADSRFKLA